MGQLSFYSADALPRAITDLEGVLCAGGGMSLFGRGTAARLTIVLGAPPPPPEEEPDDGPGPVEEGAPAGAGEPAERAPSVRATAPVPPTVPGDHREWEEGIDEIPDDDLPTRDDGPPPDAAEPPPEDPGPDPPDVGNDPMTEWRAHALCCAFRGRGVPAEVDRLPDGRPVVRSAFRADLLPLAQGWQTDPKHVPEPLLLDGPRLRLWVLAAGRWTGRAYTLGLDPSAPSTHEPLLTACQRAGLGATLAGDSDVPVVKIVGRARQRRLAELVGGRPRHLHDGVWPDRETGSELVTSRNR